MHRPSPMPIIRRPHRDGYEAEVVQGFEEKWNGNKFDELLFLFFSIWEVPQL